VWVEQAIFTSVRRQARGGYHLVSRSKGVSEADAQSLTTWSPSHGSLLIDEHNRVSVNFHPMPDGRFALSRACEGPPEYSGRGGRQLYTHIMILEDQALDAAGGQPFALYRNALALGYLFYQANPPEKLEPLKLPVFHIGRDEASWLAHSVELGLPPLDPLRTKLLAGRPVRFTYAGDRALLAECLLSSLPANIVRRTSFATSLEPSHVRPYILSLVGTTGHGKTGRK
jgi:GTPase-associated protein 1, N-terminal domain type 2